MIKVYERLVKRAERFGIKELEERIRSAERFEFGSFISFCRRLRINPVLALSRTYIEPYVSLKPRSFKEVELIGVVEEVIYILEEEEVPEKPVALSHFTGLCKVLGVELLFIRRGLSVKGFCVKSKGKFYIVGEWENRKEMARQFYQCLGIKIPHIKDHPKTLFMYSLNYILRKYRRKLLYTLEEPGEFYRRVKRYLYEV